ncbi:dTDP-glucose 4,6-dehydratase [Tenacibaculum holothuriorum]|uniref:dTDP-glucose 4,6-dehydratase n=1 Tax=Tenacibaculum holothuriorum TaxID=1635173 RepID=A0A1Y2PDW3_9FLAO|nr:NAD-dependent epimerase/dehydratase family protein [Tenacibaculum holothuriorum]OSY88191.1 dTDP-glucose 4,6-dehydratase [Tenacibaculum holothuriorum]
MKDVSILGCGWLGKPLALYLLGKEYVIKGSTTSGNKLNSLDEVKIIPFLIDIDKEFNEEIQEFLASEVLIIVITSKNVLGFKKLIQEIEKSAIRKVIFISSTSVYPSLNKVIIEEEQTINSPLVEIENAFRVNKSFETTIIRFAGLLGYDRKPGNWFEGKKIPHPKGFVNMIHQDDCIEILYQIIKQNVWGEVFNACSSHHPTREEFYTTAKIKIKKEPPIFDDSLALKYKIISSDKLQKRLNYRFIHTDLLDI